jgi:hypothetical protein
MLSTTMHHVLANASASFSPAVFDRQFHRRICAALDTTGRWEQRRRRLPASLIVLFVVFMALNRAKSIRNVFRALMSLVRVRRPSLPTRPVTEEAVCHARSRLGVEPLKVLFESLADEIRPEPTFLGLRVWGYDGVRFTVPDTKSNEIEFRRPAASRGRAAFPQILGVALVSAATREVRAVNFGSCRSSERALALPFRDLLGKGDFLLMDRGCSSAAQFEAFMMTGCHVMGRISSSWKPELIRKLGPNDVLVRLRVHDESGKRAAKSERKARRTKGNRARRGSRPGKTPRFIEMRMVIYRIGKNPPVRLLTSLLDPERFPALDLAREYHSRWECELAYDEIKTHLATVNHGTLHTVFRSKTPTGAIQEAYGTFVAYNIIRRFMAEAATRHDISPLDISFVDTVETVKQEAYRLEAAPRRHRPRLLRWLLDEIAESRNPRPRRPRVNPRVVKIKMSNYKLKRPGATERIIDHWTCIRVLSANSGCRKAA